MEKLRPARIIVCAPDKAGTRNQALGIGEALCSRLRQPTDACIGLFHWSDPLRLTLTRRSAAAPVFVVSCGPSGERKGRRLKKAGRQNVFWTHVETLKSGGRAPDLHVVPAHDWVEGEGHSEREMKILGVPHRITKAAMEQRRAAARSLLGLGPADGLVVILIGGPNPAFDFGGTVILRTKNLIEQAENAGYKSVLLSSRRTPQEVRDKLAEEHPAAIEPRLRYEDALAAADAIVVSEDSISMTCEASATGRPVFALPLEPLAGRRLDKFRRFQADWNKFLVSLEAFPSGAGAARDDPPREAEHIAARMIEMSAYRV